MPWKNVFYTRLKWFFFRKKCRRFLKFFKVFFEHNKLFGKNSTFKELLYFFRENMEHFSEIFRDTIFVRRTLHVLNHTHTRKSGLKNDATLHFLKINSYSWIIKAHLSEDEMKLVCMKKGFCIHFKIYA